MVRNRFQRHSSPTVLPTLAERDPQLLHFVAKGVGVDSKKLIGSGTNHVNPIHGADLAAACVDAMEGHEAEIAVGGPQTLTWDEVAALAFDVLEKPARISRVPSWLMWRLVRLVKIFNRHQGGLLAFFTTMATADVVAPPTGTHRLEAHFRCLGESR